MEACISGYTTTFNCITMHYPFRECLQSLLGFCDEVAVVDAGSTDGTIEELRRLSCKERRLKFSVEPVDFSHPRWAIHMDGCLKAKARALCTAEYCWQTDTDEVVIDYDYSRIRQLPAVLRDYMEKRPVVYLPMVEFWGGFDLIRADFFSWQPRFSRNLPGITHGVPQEHRLYDQWGHPYPRPFDSDSCNYIWAESGEGVPMLIPKKVDDFNMTLDVFERFFYEALDDLPSVQHVSWLDLPRKIRHYRSFWPKFHASMYNLDRADSAANNVMFSKPWSDVTDAEIDAKAAELRALGPRSFHRKIDPGKRGETIPFKRPVAPLLLEWAAREGLVPERQGCGLPVPSQPCREPAF